ncbi:MAG TPA: DUF4389 domain-containing protein [Thermoleophilaceae bacterium]
MADDLERSRVTVFFRLILAIPHLIWLFLWGLPTALFAIVNWFAVLFRGTSPNDLHELLARYIRYATHVNAYLSLAAQPYPRFLGTEGTYPVDVHFDPPGRQNRWKTGFRLILAIPAVLLAGALYGSGGARGNGYTVSLGLLAAASFLGWFACLARGRMPRGLRDAAAYALAYSAQLDAYLLVLTDRYPDSDPVATLGPAEVPEHPVELSVDDDLRRSRLTVFFRLVLTFPHFVWLVLWSIVAWVTAFINWLVTLIRGTPPSALHGFLSSYVRYQLHVTSFLYLIGNPFPGFVGREGTYPIEVRIGPPQRQNRWKTGFRLILAIPAFVIGSAYSSLISIAAVLLWFASLFTARAPRGLRNAGVAAQSYTAQLTSYLFLLTDRYPYSGPVLRGMAATPAAAEHPAPPAQA